METTFTISIDAQDITVRYRSRYFVSADYGRFEFLSPHEPRRRIPVSETGYRNHFSPMHEIEAAPNLEEYAIALAAALIAAHSGSDDDQAFEQPAQLGLF
jgi:hypothetical protein